MVNKKTLQVLRAGLCALFLLLVTGCETLPGLNSAQPGAPAPSLLQQSPRDVVNSFLDAWNRKDYQAMYLLLSSQSQGMQTFAVFQTQYEDVANAIGLSGLTYTVHEPIMQGATAVVNYDVTLSSPNFGTLEDNGRTMRLVSTPSGWRIAWTTMDIFDGLAPGTRVQVDYEAQPRGNIYDRNGNLLVEEAGTIIEVYAQRQRMPDEASCYRTLGNIMRRDYRDIARFAADYAFDTIFFIGDMDPEAYAVQAQTLADYCGITGDSGLIQERTDRRYVGHGAMTHITGYVGQATQEDIAAGFQPGDMIGQSGVERAYDAVLRGQAPRVLRITESGGTTIRTLGGAEGTPPQDVTLTIDRDLQLVTAQAIYDAYMYAEINWTTVSPGAAAVVLDVDNGAILALASYPTFNPGLFSPNTPFPFPTAYLNALPNEPFRNRVVSEQYAPGSIFKIITTAAAIDTNIVEPDELFYCDLQWTNGEEYGDTARIRLDWRASEPEEFRFPTGDVTPAGALASSCDPFYYEMGAKLFRQRSPGTLANYATRMGLAQDLLLGDIFPEAIGQVPVPNNVESAINEAIGQGDVQLTPLQIAHVVTAVANGGTRYRPYLVERVGINGQPPSFQAQPEVMATLDFSDETFAVVQQGMCDVPIDEARNTTNGEPLGTAVWVFENSYYSLCGKTGTAQTGDGRAPNAWFVAYVPADNPQIAIAVLVQNALEGSQSAAPIVRRILDDYLNVPAGNYAEFPAFWRDTYVPLQLADGVPVGG